jgi:uncharacterized protein (DUF433 family)
MLLETRYEHVVLNNSNVPMISGTTMKVIELAVSHIAYGWSAEELHFQYPYLSLGQIYSALAYYWDHREELDKTIEKQVKTVNDLRSASSESPLRKRLKAKGLI